MQNSDKVPSSEHNFSSHHLFWPKEWYKTPLEKEFRELPCNIVVLFRDVHTLLHMRSDDWPPEKPTVEQMEAMVKRYHYLKKIIKY